jgi:hypothetical protein
VDALISLSAGPVVVWEFMFEGAAFFDNIFDFVEDFYFWHLVCWQPQNLTLLFDLFSEMA